MRLNKSSSYSSASILLRHSLSLIRHMRRRRLSLINSHLKSQFLLLLLFRILVFTVLMSSPLSMNNSLMVYIPYYSTLFILVTVFMSMETILNTIMTKRSVKIAQMLKNINFLIHSEQVMTFFPSNITNPTAS